ncbi:MAG: DUF433 domain-containing protein [bacterium]|nr:DUF433 domain-containing protein [bacterium]
MKKYIISDPQILSGRPVIAGTRIPVDQVLFLLKEGFTIEAIHEQYPHVSTATISGTVSEAAQFINNNVPKIS